MAAISQTTITLPENLAVKARAFADQRKCSLDDLADEAIRSFMGLSADLDPRVQAVLQRAWDLGLTPDEYAVRAVKEVRAEMRAESARTEHS